MTSTSKNSDILDLTKYRSAVQALCEDTDAQPTVQKYLLTDGDIPALLEIASVYSKIPADIDEIPAAAGNAIRCLPQLDTETVAAGLLTVFKTFDWAAVEFNGGRSAYIAALRQLLERSPETVFGLLFDALTECVPHGLEQRMYYRTEDSRIVILEAIAESTLLPAELRDKFNAYLVTDLKERRTGWRNWYAKTISVLALDKMSGETRSLIRETCLQGFVDLTALTQTTPKLLGFDFENDKEFLPLYKDFTAISWIIRDFEHFSPPFHPQTIRLARKHKDFILPSLLEIVRKLTEYIINEVEYSAPKIDYALSILAEFQPAEALPAVLDLLWYDEGLFKEFLSDSLCEDVPGLLYRIAGNSVHFYTDCLRRSGVPDTVSYDCVYALLYLVADKSLSRDTFFEILSAALEKAIAEKKRWLVSSFVCLLADSQNPKYHPLIKKAFTEDLVLKRWCSLTDLIEIEDEDPFQYSLPEDVHQFDDAEKNIGSWLCFNEPERFEPEQYQKERDNTYAVFDGDFDDDMDDIDFSVAERNKPCPCGSGKKYKVCHGKGN